MENEARNPEHPTVDPSDEGVRRIVRRLMDDPGLPTLEELLERSEVKSLLEEATDRPEDLLRRLGELEPELQWAYWMVERMWRDQSSPPHLAELGVEAMAALTKLHGEAFLAAARAENAR